MSLSGACFPVSDPVSKPSVAKDLQGKIWCLLLWVQLHFSEPYASSQLLLLEAEAKFLSMPKRLPNPAAHKLAVKTVGKTANDLVKTSHWLASNKRIYVAFFCYVG